MAASVGVPLILTDARAQATAGCLCLLIGTTAQRGVSVYSLGPILTADLKTMQESSFELTGVRCLFGMLIKQMAKILLKSVCFLALHVYSNVAMVPPMPPLAYCDAC